MMSPIAPAVTIFLPSPILSESPADVSILKPPKMIATMTTIPKNPRMIRMIFWIVCLMSCELKPAKEVGKSIDTPCAWAACDATNIASVANILLKTLLRVFIWLHCTPPSKKSNLVLASVVCYKQYAILRVWYSGIMSPFQGEETGSIPVTRSTRLRYLR